MVAGTCQPLEQCSIWELAGHSGSRWISRIMFTVGNVDRYIDRYVGRRSGRQSIDTRSTVDRESTDYRSSVDRLSTSINRLSIDCRPLRRSTVHGLAIDIAVDAPRPNIGYMSVVYRPTVGDMSVNCRSHIGQLSVAYRSTVGRILVVC